MYHFSFSWLVRIALLALTSITVVMIGVSVVTRHDMPDPFSVFSDLFGSDARQAALARGFTCGVSGVQSRAQFESGYCAQDNTNEVFSGIYMRMSGNDASEISFSLRENALTLGDLVLLMGNPEIQQTCETTVASWPARHVIAFIPPAGTRGISDFLPVQSVSFALTGTPQWGQLLMKDASLNCGSGGE